MKFIIKKENKIYKIIDILTGDEYARTTKKEESEKLLKYTKWLFTTDVKPHDTFSVSKVKEEMDSLILD
jgi:hypothetical protein